MELNTLSLADLQDYRLIRLESLKTTPFAFSDSYKDIESKPMDFFASEIAPPLPAKEVFVLGAWNENKELLGFLRFYRDQRMNARHKAFIHNMYVSPQARKRSVGTCLMEYIFQYAKKMGGLEQIHLWVLIHNGNSAIGFYEKLGFQLQGPYIKKDLIIQGETIDAAYMVKELI